MKKIILTLIVSLTGCYGAQISQLEKQNAELMDQNRRLWAAKGDSASSPTAQAPAPAPMPAAYQGGMQVRTAVMAARRQHGPYMGATGAQPRQMTQGSKIRTDNTVCDNGSRGVWSRCEDADRNGYPDFNSFLAYRIDNQPAIFDTPYVHPDTGESLLAPQQTAYVELGANCIVDVTVEQYRNVGTPQSPMFGPTPNRTRTFKGFNACDSNITYLNIDESRF